MKPDMKSTLIALICMLCMGSGIQMNARDLSWRTHRTLYGIFSMIDPQDNCTDVTIEGKDATHRINLDNQGADNLIRKWKNSDTRREIERNFKVNFVANIRTKGEIEFLRNLGDKGLNYIIELKSPYQEIKIKMEPWELKDIFHWNQ